MVSGDHDGRLDGFYFTGFLDRFLRQLWGNGKVQFSEKELVDLLCKTPEGWQALQLLDPIGSKRTLHSFLKISREVTIGENKRVDVLLNDNSLRVNIIVEAKIYADVNAVEQALKYRKIFFNDKWPGQSYRGSNGKVTSGMYSVLCALAAQFFSEQTLFLCQELGIPCIHIIPINKSRMDFGYLIKPSKENRKRQLHLKSRGVFDG